MRNLRALRACCSLTRSDAVPRAAAAAANRPRQSRPGAVRAAAAAAALGAATGAASALLGAAGAWPAAGAAALLLAAVVGAAAAGHRLYWWVHLLLLAGYAFLGKSFALLGARGVYVGEAVLALGALTLLVTAARGSRLVPALRLTPEVVACFLFIVWQAGRTLPFVATHGADALRDAALWGYSAFAFLAWLMVPQQGVDRFLEWFRRLIPAFLVWVLAVWVFRTAFNSGAFPFLADLPPLRVKPGDVGVHLGGVAAFLLVQPVGRGRPWRPAAVWTLWSLWWAAWLVFGIANRGGMVSAVLAFAVAAVLRPECGWRRPLAVAAIAAAALLAVDLEIELRAKSVSVAQVAKNVASLVTAVDERLDVTKAWRLQWWRQILDDALRPEHAVLGLGYGVNLGERYGHRGPDGALRSPHNVFMTILARAGFPGLLLWVVFLVLLLGRLAVLGASRSGGTGGVGDRAVWLLAYLVAFLFNASFDVFLEGPMGGIWFWSLVGTSWLVTARRRPGNAVPGATLAPSSSERS